jgi:hypothetical protein
VKTGTPALRAGLVEACDDEQLFAVQLTSRQRELLAVVEARFLLHVWALGRRSGKTLLAALVALWTCLLRPELVMHVRPRERIYTVAAATNLRQARIFVEQARSIVATSPLLAGLVEYASDDEIVFRNGRVLAAFPCTSRGGRGWPVATLLLDEAAHMLDTDGNQAAEPLFRALVPSTAQFGLAARVIVASSPYGTDGFFHDLFHNVEDGRLDDATCAQVSTAEMRPGFETAALKLEQARDPESFRAEYLAEFVAAGSAYLDARRVVETVADRGELPPGKIVDAQAAVDLAFQADASALAILGRDRNHRDRLRLVLARSWAPRPGAPLSFSAVLDDVADLCLQHRVDTVYMDQFHAASAREHLERRGLRASVVPTTPASKSAMFADLKARLYGSKLELYDHPLLLAELHRIETVTTNGAASVRIRRAGASHGDLATALALAAWKMRPRNEIRMRVYRPKGRIPTAEDRFLDDWWNRF